MRYMKQVLLPFWPLSLNLKLTMLVFCCIFFNMKQILLADSVAILTFFLVSEADVIGLFPFIPLYAAAIPLVILLCAANEERS